MCENGFFVFMNISSNNTNHKPSKFYNIHLCQSKLKIHMSFMHFNAFKGNFNYILKLITLMGVMCR